MLLVGQYDSLGELSEEDGQPVLRFQLRVMNRTLNRVTGAVIKNDTVFNCVRRGPTAPLLCRKAYIGDTLSIEGYLEITRPPPIDGESQPRVFTIHCERVEWMPPQVNAAYPKRR